VCLQVRVAVRTGEASDYTKVNLRVHDEFGYPAGEVGCAYACG